MALGLFKLSSDYLRIVIQFFLPCLKMQIDRLMSPYSFFITRKSTSVGILGLSLISWIRESEDALKVSISSISVPLTPPEVMTSPLCSCHKLCALHSPMQKAVLVCSPWFCFVTQESDLIIWIVRSNTDILVKFSRIYMSDCQKEYAQWLIVTSLY